MKKRPLTIRMTLLLIVSALIIIITLLVGKGVYTSWMHYKEAQALKSGTEVINNLYMLNKNLSLTRAVTLSLLYSDIDNDSTLRKEVVKNRKEVDRLFAITLSTMIFEINSELSKKSEQIKAIYQKLLLCRIEVDKALQLPIENRDSLIASRFFETNSSLVAEIQNFILIYSRSYQGLDPTINQHMMFEYLVWELAEYSGKQYAIIGQMIAQNKHPTAQQQEQLIYLREHIEYSWEILHKFSINDALAEKLQPIMDEANTQYFFTFDQINELFYTPQTTTIDAKYPITSELWLGLSSQAVDSLLVLQDQTLKETQSQVDSIELNAKSEIFISLFIFLCALILSFYCWSIIVFRVIRPVNSMVDTLYSATQDNAFDMPNISDDRDEIGKLARVLKAFQNNARKIKESNEELERFAYIAAHDLKSPLKAVDNISQWLEEDLANLLPEQSQKHFNELRNRVRLMDKLLDDTLEYARLNTKMDSYENQIVSGEILVKEIATLLGPPTGFSINVGRFLAQLNVQKFPLQQVLYNLINNAVKHHDKETGRIEVEAEEIDNNYLFTVQDDGQGIEPKYHQKIFEMFQTLHPREKNKGRGMGLAMVRKIVVSNGGTISVESDLGKGATFRFTWPKVKMKNNEVADADIGERYA